MSSSTAIKAARAFVEVFIDDKELQRGVKRVQASMRSMAAGIAKVGGALFGAATAAGAPLLAAVTKFVAKGDEIDKMSKRTGIAAETLSRMGFALEQSGGELADFQRGLKGMANFLQGAERGLSTSVDTMNDLGLSMGDLEDITPEDRFLLFADRIAGVEDPTRRAALAMDVFGRAGQSMLPLLADGPGAIAALTKEADGLGRTITAEQAASAAKLGDAWNRVKSVFLGVALQVGGALAPSLTRLADLTAENGARVVQWVKDNQSLVVTVAKGIAIVGAAGAALLALSATIYAGAAAFGAAATGAAALSAGLSFLALSPIGWVIIAVGLLVAAFMALEASGVDVSGALSVGFIRFTGVIAELLLDVQSLVGWMRILANSTPVGLAFDFAELDAADTSEQRRTIREDVQRRIASLPDGGENSDVAGVETGAMDVAAEFRQVVADLKSGAISHRVSTATAPAASKDLRTVAGFAEITNLINGGNVQQRQLRAMEQTRDGVERAAEALEEPMAVEGFDIG